MYGRIIAVQLVVALALICALLFTRSEHSNSLFRRQTSFGDEIGAAFSNVINDFVSPRPFNTPVGGNTAGGSAATTTVSSATTTTATTTSTRFTSASRTSMPSSSSSRKTSSSSKTTSSSSKTSTSTRHTTTSVPRTTVQGTFVVTKYTTKDGTRVAKTITTTGTHVLTGTAALNHSSGNNGGHGLTSSDKKIIAGVVGGIGGAALLGGLLLLFFKLRNRSSEYDDDDDLMMEHKGSYYDNPTTIGETHTNGLERYASRSGNGSSPSAAPSSVPVSANF